MSENRIKIENPSLKEAMRGLKENKEDDFIRELLKARLLCPAKIEGAPEVKTGEGPMQIGGKLTMFALKAQDGASYLMAFTDGEELYKWRQNNNEKALVWALPQYAGILEKPDCPHAGFVINPFGENVIIKKEYLNKIRQKLRIVRKPIVLGGEEELVTDYSTFPEGLVEALCAYMKESGDISRAYLINMVKENEQDYLLVVKTSENPRYLFPCIANAASPYLQGKKMNILPIESELAAAAIRGIKPIFIH